MKNTDLATTAAWIDGEGCIIIAKNAPAKKYKIRNNRYRLDLQVGNTDERIIDWLLEKHGGRKFIPNKRHSKYMFYEWRLNGEKAAAVLKKCLPYFVIKKEQALLAISFQENKTDLSGTNCPTPKKVLTTREYYYKELQRLKNLYKKLKE